MIQHHCSKARSAVSLLWVIFCLRCKVSCTVGLLKADVYLRDYNDFFSANNKKNCESADLQCAVSGWRGEHDRLHNNANAWRLLPYYALKWILCCNISFAIYKYLLLTTQQAWWTSFMAICCWELNLELCCCKLKSAFDEFVMNWYILFFWFFRIGM